MTRTTMESRGIRLHPALWAAIDRQAKETRLRPTDYLRRRIEDLFSFDPEVQEVPHNVSRLHNDPQSAATVGEAFE